MRKLHSEIRNGFTLDWYESADGSQLKVTASLEGVLLTAYELPPAPGGPSLTATLDAVKATDEVIAQARMKLRDLKIAQAGIEAPFDRELCGGFTLLWSKTTRRLDPTDIRISVVAWRAGYQLGAAHETISLADIEKFKDTADAAAMRKSAIKQAETKLRELGVTFPEMPASGYIVEKLTWAPDGTTTLWKESGKVTRWVSGDFEVDLDNAWGKFRVCRRT